MAEAPAAEVPVAEALSVQLPRPIIQKRSRMYPRRCCPTCGTSSRGRSWGFRTLHDLGDPASERPVDVTVQYSKHWCPQCATYFNAPMDDLAPARWRYTHRVIERAVALVVEDGVPLREASWRLWRSHWVFVPWGTLYEWVRERGEKGEHREGLPALGA